MGKKVYVDLTHPFSAEIPRWPYFDKPEITNAHTMAKGGVLTSKITCTMHTGTHCDAPRHVMEYEFDGRRARYSDEKADLQACQVLVVDGIGFLSSIYRYGIIAYIGGGFGKGIHNTLEAAVYGIPVIFGPRHEKFKEALDLLKQGGGFTINKTDEFTSLVDSLIENPAITKTAGQNALSFVQSQLGATDAIIRQLVD